MGFLIDKVKLKAASSSMQQFYATVRAVYPEAPDDAAVEAATAFLYVRLVNDVFDRRFAGKLRRRLPNHYKFASPVKIHESAGRIGRFNEVFLRKLQESGTPAPTQFAEHVRCLIRALLAEAGFPHDDEQLIREAFPRFENAVRRIKTHLTGIKKQNHFIMKR